MRKQRELRRQTRRKAAVVTISLVGYTNAGKSTLFNSLTGAEVYAADKLFATLDPTLRRVELPAAGEVILADTVGFIRHLPHDLVAAFRATLEETVEANLLLHVIDAHDDERHAYMDQVNRVLNEIGAGDIPQIEVYNKIDRVDGVTPRIDFDKEGRPCRVWLSAQSGDGVELLTQALTQHFLERKQAHEGESDVGAALLSPLDRVLLSKDGGLVRQTFLLAPDAGRLRAQLYEWDVVVEEGVTEDGEGVIVVIMATPELLAFLEKQEGCSIVPKMDVKLTGSA